MKMGFNTRRLIYDEIEQPVPQYYNPTSDYYEVVLGSGGSVQTLIAGNVMEFYGKSTDVKPTTNVITGSTFFEIDTKNGYMFDGSNWEEL